MRNVAIYSKKRLMTQLKTTGWLVVLLVAGCKGMSPLPNLRPEVDLSLVDCGYKWFQSGYGPTLALPCEQDRSALRGEQRALAREHAWETARTRCPESCPPIEIEDSIEVEERFVDGVCRNGFAYFSTRVFFQCGS